MKKFLTLLSVSLAVLFGGLSLAKPQVPPGFDPSKTASPAPIDLHTSAHLQTATFALG